MLGPQLGTTGLRRTPRGGVRLDQMGADESSAEDVVNCDRHRSCRHGGQGARRAYLFDESTKLWVVLLQWCDQDAENPQLLELIEIALLLGFDVSIAVADHHHEIVLCGQSRSATSHVGEVRVGDVEDHQRNSSAAAGGRRRSLVPNVTELTDHRERTPSCFDAATRCGWLRTLLTVATETPACRATSLMLLIAIVYAFARLFARGDHVSRFGVRLEYVSSQSAIGGVAPSQ